MRIFFGFYSSFPKPGQNTAVDGYQNQKRIFKVIKDDQK
jgi:hypothetical protein